MNAVNGFVNTMNAIGINKDVLLCQAVKDEGNGYIPTMYLVRRKEFNTKTMRVVLSDVAQATLIAGLFSITRQEVQVFPL